MRYKRFELIEERGGPQAPFAHLVDETWPVTGCLQGLRAKVMRLLIFPLGRALPPISVDRATFSRKGVKAYGIKDSALCVQTRRRKNQDWQEISLADFPGLINIQLQCHQTRAGLLLVLTDRLDRIAPLGVDESSRKDVGKWISSFARNFGGNPDSQQCEFRLKEQKDDKPTLFAVGSQTTMAHQLGRTDLRTKDYRLAGWNLVLGSPGAHNANLSLPSYVEDASSGLFLPDGTGKYRDRSISFCGRAGGPTVSATWAKVSKGQGPIEINKGYTVCFAEERQG